MQRIGYRMRQIVYYVENNPGCTIREAAMATRRHSNEGHKYGYASAHRAIKAGLIEDRGGEKKGQYSLYIPEKNIRCCDYDKNAVHERITR